MVTFRLRMSMWWVFRKKSVQAENNPDKTWLISMCALKNLKVSSTPKGLAMSIKVKTKLLTAWHNDLPDQIKVEMVNEIAEDFATEIRNALGNLQCQAHPGKNSRITVVADRVNQVNLETRFCCAKFGKKVSVKIGKRI